MPPFKEKCGGLISSEVFFYRKMISDIYMWILNFVLNKNVVQFNPNYLIILLKTGNMKQHLSKLECLALLAGCLCHDVDHRGTNNAFQAKYVL